MLLPCLSGVISTHIKPQQKVAVGSVYWKVERVRLRILFFHDTLYYTLSSTSRSSESSLFFRLSKQNFVYIPHVPHMSCSRMRQKLWKVVSRGCVMTEATLLECGSHFKFLDFIVWREAISYVSWNFGTIYWRRSSKDGFVLNDLRNELRLVCFTVLVLT